MARIKKPVEVTKHDREQKPDGATGGEGLASGGSTGATSGSRGTAGTGGAGYTNPGGSTGGPEGERGHVPGHATEDVPNDAWPFKQPIKKP
jgi:hypothetical protein